MTRMQVQLRVDPGESRSACALLAQAAGLSKLRVKDAMRKGAVWCQRAGAGEHRLRRAQPIPPAGSMLALYYDPEVLARVAPLAECMHDRARFSIWFKPAGLMTQGTRFGDRCSLLRRPKPSCGPGGGPFWSTGTRPEQPKRRGPEADGLRPGVQLSVHGSTLESCGVRKARLAPRNLRALNLGFLQSHALRAHRG